jgi:hypothetical protein
MAELSLPLFVRLKDCGDVVCYDSIASMQTYFEPIDVENEEYEAWDAAGTRLQLSVKKSADWLRVESTEKSEPEQLASAIAAFAQLQGVHLDVSKLRAGDFRGVLEQVTSAVHAKRQSASWWRRRTRRL